MFILVSKPPGCAGGFLLPIVSKFVDILIFGKVGYIHKLVVNICDTAVANGDDGAAVHFLLPITAGAGFAGEHQSDSLVLDDKVVAVIVAGQNVCN